MVKSNSNNAHLLVIRLSSMGDVAMTVPVILALTQQYPNVNITLLTRGFFKPMFSHISNVRVYEIELNGRHKGVRGLWRLYKELKALNIDAVADMHNVLRSNILKSYFGLGKIPFVQIDKGRKEKKALTAPQKKVFEPLKTTHQRYADVLAKLGYEINLQKVALLAKRQLSGKTLQIVGTDTKKWLGIAPFAAYQGKMYPLELMQTVVGNLNQDNKYKILLFGGGKKEIAQLNYLSNAMDNVINVSGKLSFEEELELISNLDLMLSMDSANAHLAAMFAIPVLTLWGVTHPYAGFLPFGAEMQNTLLANREQYPMVPTSVYGNKLPKGYERAMETITPQEILLKIDLLINKK
ncbi:glycosyltransferase family 9 protein [Spongiimicrobium sp. 3-5]|uniref:glycosyltransferase family 9 protein n=1 Tax=Spongiimicrobium sp. 3-5 TaxID=3332596 RepID=UPI00397FB9C2